MVVSVGLVITGILMWWACGHWQNRHTEKSLAAAPAV